MFPSSDQPQEPPLEQRPPRRVVLGFVLQRGLIGGAFTVTLGSLEPTGLLDQVGDIATDAGVAFIANNIEALRVIARAVEAAPEGQFHASRPQSIIDVCGSTVTVDTALSFAGRIVPDEQREAARSLLNDFTLAIITAINDGAVNEEPKDFTPPPLPGVGPELWEEFCSIFCVCPMCGKRDCTGAALTLFQALIRMEKEEWIAAGVSPAAADVIMDNNVVRELRAHLEGYDQNGGEPVELVDMLATLLSVDR